MASGSIKHTVVERSGLEVHVLDLVGQFVGGKECDELEQVLRGFAQRGRCTVLVSLRHTETLSSIVIGLLVGAHTSIQRSGGVMVLGRFGEEDGGGGAGIFAKLVPPPKGPNAAILMALDEETRRTGMGDE
jgi:hypothetical protein